MKEYSKQRGELWQAYASSAHELPCYKPEFLLCRFWGDTKTQMGALACPGIQLVVSVLFCFFRGEEELIRRFLRIAKINGAAQCGMLRLRHLDTQYKRIIRLIVINRMGLKKFLLRIWTAVIFVLCLGLPVQIHNCLSLRSHHFQQEGGAVPEEQIWQIMLFKPVPD